MRNILWLAPPLAALFVGCGDKDKDSGEDEGDASAEGMSDLSIDGLGDGDTEKKEGGTVALTEDEYDAIAMAGCADWTATGEPLPAVLQLVVDVSGSMEEDAPGSNESKWEVTRDALEAAIADLPEETSVGVLYYPNLPDNAGGGNGGPGGQGDLWCVDEEKLVSIAPLDDAHRATVQMSLDDAEVNTLTPTHDAYDYALNNSLLGSESSNRFMLLITDGAPTAELGCDAADRGETSPTGPIIDAIGEAASEHDVKTFIIGAPGSETSPNGDEDMRGWLSEAAEAGQTASGGCSNSGPDFCHMDMTQEPDFGAALQAGLNQVVGTIASGCTFEVPAPPEDAKFDLSQTNLVVTSGSGDSTLVIQDETGDCDEGWELNDAGEIELCSDTCDTVLADEESKILLTFGCSTEDIIPVR